ncbi:MAG TPA: redox-sensing transcriptional repressor Rex [Candidatus Enterenecus avicola]|nr:redox-sensing transcriptional repressor Rex [Candidatus Enterenecus avicola]
MKKDKISSAVIRRLPRYYRHLDDLYRAGTIRISSGALAQSMGLTASQIRQDLSCFGGFGQQGYGYNVERLRGEVAEILGMNKGHTVLILGAGNLGRALIENFPFRANGFRLVAAFDVDPHLVDTKLGGVPVYHIDGLDTFVREHRVSVAVLTVPGAVAVDTARRLSKLGVDGIWNFTNVELPEQEMPEVKVENVHFADSLLTLSYMISEEEV